MTSLVKNSTIIKQVAVKIEQPLKVEGVALPADPFYVADNYKDNPIRLVKAHFISTLLCKCREFDDMVYRDQVAVIVNIERSCFNEAIRKTSICNVRSIMSSDNFIKIYIDICYKITYLLDTLISKDSSLDVIKQIVNNSIVPDQIAHMKVKNLCPNKFQNEMNDIGKKRAVRRHIKYTSLHYCNICKKNRCKIEKRFNRSLDESVNQTIRCVNCGHSWCA